MKFKIGDRVRETGLFKSAEGEGTIISIGNISFLDLYCVEFDKKQLSGHNGSLPLYKLKKGEKYGKNKHCLYFLECHLQLVKQKIDTKVVQVVFKNNNLPYSFLNDIEDLEIGDKVVVDTRYGYEIATVKSFDDDKKATKMVVCKINTKEFEEKRARINKELENEKQRNIRKETLLEKMKQVYASNSKLDEYKRMAKKNKEMAELLKDYEDVENGIWQPEEWNLPF